MKNITDQRTIAKRGKRKSFLLRQGSLLTRKLFFLDGQANLGKMLFLIDKDSPIEEIFLLAAYEPLTALGMLHPQYNVFGGRYQLDFALLGRNWKIAIECDGREFHCTEEQLSADNRRDIELQCDEWGIARFRGTDIYDDPAGCVAQVERMARAMR